MIFVITNISSKGVRSMIKESGPHMKITNIFNVISHNSYIYCKLKVTCSPSKLNLFLVQPNFIGSYNTIEEPFTVNFQ